MTYRAGDIEFKSVSIEKDGSLTINFLLKLIDSFLIDTVSCADLDAWAGLHDEKKEKDGDFNKCPTCGRQMKILFQARYCPCCEGKEEEKKKEEEPKPVRRVNYHFF